MNIYFALLLTLIAGLFFIIGAIIEKNVKDKKKLANFSISLAFIVMLNLIIFDLIPEIKEIFNINSLNIKCFWLLLLIFLGIMLLKTLDLFIPDHHHDHHDNEKNIKEHNSHNYHIGLVTLISLFIHNVLEGIAIYGVALNNIRLGILMCLGVALHNIPLGIEIAISLASIKEKKHNNKVLFSLLAVSSLIGGAILFLIKDVNEILLGVITCITLGMLIYIAFRELLPEIINNKRKKEIYYGIIVGVMILLLTLFI